MSERDDSKPGGTPPGGGDADKSSDPAKPTESAKTGPTQSAKTGPPATPSGDKSSDPAKSAGDTPPEPAKSTESTKPAPPAKPVQPAKPEGAKPAAPVKRAPRPDPVAEKLKAEVPSVPLDRLRGKLPGGIGEVTYFAGVPIVLLSRDALVEACRFLKDDADCDMKYLSNLCGAHYPDRDEPFDVVYHLYSITHGHRLTLKVRTTESVPVPTVSTVWRTANWHEREAYDMYGVRFEGHPDLTRILLPDDWNGHPLRKDYPLEGNPGDHKHYRQE